MVYSMSTNRGWFYLFSWPDASHIFLAEIVQKWCWTLLSACLLVPLGHWSWSLGQVKCLPAFLTYRCCFPLCIWSIFCKEMFWNYPTPKPPSTQPHIHWPLPLVPSTPVMVWLSANDYFPRSIYTCWLVFYFKNELSLFSPLYLLTLG